MINVLSVISELNFGGGENRIFNLARAIDPKRFRLMLATLYLPPGERRFHCSSMRRQFADAGIDVYDLALPHPADSRIPRVVKIANTAATLATAIARLRQLIVSSRADIVDAHLETALFTAVPAAASAGVPATATLYSELDLWKLGDAGSYRQALFPPIRRLNLRLCSAILTDSRARAADFERYLGASAPPLHVIPNGVRLGAPSRPRADVLRALEVPERATIVGQIAGLVPYKGQTLLVEAAARAIERGHDVYVLCVGDERMGPAYPRELRRRTEALGIADRVRIGGYPGNIADVWNAIDIHVHASSIDSLPNAVIEGMSLAKPAVVSAVGAIPDHVDHGRTGLVVPPNDAPALAEALLRVLEDPALARRLGQGAYERYLERFTPEATARRIEAVFESTIEAHRRRRAS